MKLLKKTAATLAALIAGATLVSAMSFDVSVSAGYKGIPCVGLSSNVSQNLTDNLTIDSSVIHLPTHEYEATLKGTHQVTPWFAAGAGFLLFTDEQSMLPAITGSIEFKPTRSWTAGFSGGFGLNEKNLTLPYLFRVGHYANFITQESIIDLKMQWQLLKPDAFVRNDITGELKIYAISPDNAKFKLCLGMDGSYRMDSRSDLPFTATAGVNFGFDYGTEKQGYGITYSITPFTTDTFLKKEKAEFLPWMVTSGIRFLY
ncbi:MAG: hypothetical protein MJ178_04970 [Treponemataceae bacterium]|nr:hypothetical protein [Treponemataceae bacterium]